MSVFSLKKTHNLHAYTISLSRNCPSVIFLCYLSLFGKHPFLIILLLALLILQFCNSSLLTTDKKLYVVEKLKTPVRSVFIILVLTLSSMLMIYLFVFLCLPQNIIPYANLISFFRRSAAPFFSCYIYFKVLNLK